MLKLNQRESVKPIFRKLKLLTFPSLFIFRTVLLIKSKKHPQNFEIHNYYTRNREDYRLSEHRISKFEKSPNYIGAVLYNNLLKDLKTTTGNSEKLFIKKLFSFLIEKSLYSVNEFLTEKSD